MDIWKYFADILKIVIQISEVDLKRGPFGRFNFPYNIVGKPLFKWG